MILMIAAPAGLESGIVGQAVMTKGAAGASVAGMAGTGAKGAGLIGNAGLSGTASNGAQVLTTSGTLWSGKGLSLGLGLGLGVWGPILVVAAGAAAVYGYLEYRKRQEGGTDEQIEQEADEGFYPANG
jgi:hypothetical protein